MTVRIGKKPNAARYQGIAEIEKELRSTLPWLWQPAFEINTGQGYDGSAFGARTGTLDSISAMNILHEVSHAIDMTLLPDAVWKYRLRQPDFDMRIRSYQDIIGYPRSYEPVTMQATQRECRVGGIQLRLLEAGGYDTTDFVENYVVMLKYMADAAFGGRSPLNAPDRAQYTKKHWKWIAKRTQWLHDGYNQFALVEIKDRWDVVMDWLGQPAPEAELPSPYENLIAA